MIAQGIILHAGKVLMVRQYVARGDIVWNYPGGGIEAGESPTAACIREVKEETGLDVEIVRLLAQPGEKFTFLVKVTGGEIGLDKEHADNEDLIEVAWVELGDDEKFDHVTDPIRQLLIEVKAVEGMR